MPDCLAERVGWALRARACRCAAAPVEQGSHPQPPWRENKKAPQGGLFIFWRWGEPYAEHALSCCEPVNRLPVRIANHTRHRWVSRNRVSGCLDRT